MPKLYLHAGTHKTGTTALQQFGHTNRRELLARGLFYADYGDDSLGLRDGHHQFAHTLAANEPDSRDRLSSIVNYWYSVAKAEGVPVLVSTEALWRHKWPTAASHWVGRAEYLRRLADLLLPFEVEVIIVYRRPDDFARSVYQEGVATGLKRLPDFDEWIKRDHTMLQYTKNAAVLTEPFPRGQHWVYEDLVRDGGLYAKFFGGLGVSIEGLKSPDLVRQSLSPAETVVKNYANQYISKRTQGRKFVTWMREEGLCAEIESGNPGELSLWASPRDRLRFIARREEDLSELRSRFFPGREQRLFPEVKGSDDYVVPRLTPAIAARVDKYFAP